MALSRKATLPTRTALASVVTLGAISALAQSRRAPIPSTAYWWTHHNAQILLATLIGVAILLWCPTPRAWRRPVRSALGALLIMLLPLATLALAVQHEVEQRLWIGAWHARLAKIEVPLPAGAFEVRNETEGAIRTIRFALREPYPSTATADFYSRYLTPRQYRAYPPSPWRRTIGYYDPPRDRARRGYLTYSVLWTNDRQQVHCDLSLRYELPEGVDQSLPLDQWKREWLEVQRVKVMLLPSTLPG